jgi:hypothetical protein
MFAHREAACSCRLRIREKRNTLEVVLLSIENIPIIMFGIELAHSIIRSQERMDFQGTTRRQTVISNSSEVK